MKSKSVSSINDLIDRYRSTVVEHSSAPKLNFGGGTHFDKKIALSVNEFALCVGVSPRTAERILKRGEIQYKKVGRRVVIPVTAVETWLNQKD